MIISMDMMTTTEIAARFGYDASHVRRLCINGDLAGAVKVGRDWLVPRKSVESHKRGKPGRKPKPATKKPRKQQKGKPGDRA